MLTFLDQTYLIFKKYYYASSFLSLEIIEINKISKKEASVILCE